jgi:predicted dehydrogenase
MGLKIGILGTGKVASSNYLPFLSRQADVSLLYHSRTRTKAEACAEEFGGRVVDSALALLDEEPDAILVLTRETQRYDATVSLMDSGIPRRLFFEKPLVAQAGQANVRESDFYQARGLLQRAAALGIETAMVFNYRFFDQVVRARGIVSERGWGELVQASLWVHYACWSHCIDLLRLFGGPAAQVTALTEPSAPLTGNERGVNLAAAFCLENGATGTLLGTGSGHFDFWLYELLLRFEGGVLRLNDLDGPLDVLDNRQRYAETYDLIGHHSRWDQYKASFEKSISAYLDSIRRDQPPPVPGLAGLQELQFEAALRRSAAQSRPVDVQAEFPLDTASSPPATDRRSAGD